MTLSVIFMETTWSAIRCCQSRKLSERSLVLRQTLDWTMFWWHILETPPVQLLIISQTFLTLCSLILPVIPDTNAVSERSPYRYLRTTMLSQKKIESLNDSPWTWQTLEISLFQHKMTGKIALENSVSIKTFSNHVLNGSVAECRGWWVGVVGVVVGKCRG